MPFLILSLQQKHIHILKVR